MPRWAVLHGVAEEVRDDLPDVHILAQDDRQSGGCVHGEMVRRGSGTFALDGGLHDVAHDDRLRRHLQPATLGAAQDEQVLRQAAQPIGLRFDVAELVGQGLGGHGRMAFAKEMAHPVDRRDRRTKLMADDPDERIAELAVPLLLGVSDAQIRGRRGQFFGESLAGGPLAFERSRRSEEIRLPPRPRADPHQHGYICGLLGSRGTNGIQQDRDVITGGRCEGEEHFLDAAVGLQGGINVGLEEDPRRCGEQHVE